MKKYLFSLDYLRGVAAISVCLFHFTDKLDYLSTNDLFKKIFSFGHFGVEIFFIISGLIIPYSMAKGKYTPRKFFIFLKKRFIRIEPPYIFCVFLALVLNYITTVTPFYKGEPFSIDYAQVFYHIGYLNVFMGKDWLNQVFWTLAIEFQYYLLIALVYPLISHKKQYVWISTLILFNASSFFFSRDFVFNFSIYFTTGIVLYRYFLNLSGKTELLLALCAIIAFLFLKYSFIELFVVMLTAIFILVPVKPMAFSTVFGNLSYSLYLLHMPIGLRVINLTQRFTDSQSIRQAAILVALVLTIVVSYYFYLLIEKPFKEISQRIKYDNNKEIQGAVIK